MKRSKLSRRITWHVIGIMSFFNVLIIGVILVFVFRVSLMNSNMRGQQVEKEETTTVSKNGPSVADQARHAVRHTFFLKRLVNLFIKNMSAHDENAKTN